MTDLPHVGRFEVSQAASSQAHRRWWDDEAAGYYADHGQFLGDRNFVWGPEGWTEAQLGLLGVQSGDRVLEIGSGAGQCSRWLSDRGITSVASDLSIGMLRQARAVDRTGGGPPLINCDALALPFADTSFDIVFTAYGAIPFVADSAGIMREAYRVTRPGGRFVFASSHPFRWAFPDDAGPRGLTVEQSYFDRRPYVEVGSSGEITYVEHHRTIGDRIRELVAAGWQLLDLIEPEWPDSTTTTWGGWSPLRGKLIPGTAIFVATRG